MSLPVVLFTLAGCIIIKVMFNVLKKPLSTKMNLSVTTANWIEEAVNIIAQATLLVGCYLLNKIGFFHYKENK